MSLILTPTDPRLRDRQEEVCAWLRENDIDPRRCCFLRVDGNTIDYELFQEGYPLSEDRSHVLRDRFTKPLLTPPPPL